MVYWFIERWAQRHKYRCSWNEHTRKYKMDSTSSLIDRFDILILVTERLALVK